MPGKKSFGAKLQYRESTGPDVWVDIANITKISPFNLKVDSVDVSSMDSPDEYREKVPGFKDAGEANFELNYDDEEPTHQLLSEIADGTVGTWRIIYPNTTFPKTTQTFSGFISQVGPEIPYDGKMTANCVINVSSKPVFGTVAA